MAEEPYDLSDFIMGGKGGEGCKTLLISDFEGTTPKTHFEKFKEYCTNNKDVDDKEKRVIFLGDVFDNTSQFGTYCTGEECIDPDEEDGNCVSNVNYCALQTIKILVDDGEKEKNCRYVVGNRDINKIKLLPFFSLRDGTKWWTEGESYEEIVKKLLETLADAKKKTNPWLVQGKENLKYFKPFWKDQAMHKNKTWAIDVVDIYDRFELIFGKDPDKGTMSALVTLKCIPNEIYENTEKKMLDFYKSVKEKVDYTIVKCPQDLKNIVESKKDIKAELAKEANADWLNDVTWRKQVRAALTLTIFMRMLDKDLLVKEEKSTLLNELGTLDGYLYKYLTEAPAAYYAYYNHTYSDNKKDLFLFAHGGVTNAFIKEKGLKGIENVKKELTYWDEKLKQTGGEGEITDVGMAITNYNKGYSKLVNNFFNMREVLKKLDAQKFTDPSIKKYWLLPMLSLLKLSAGDYPKPNDERGSTSYYPNQAKEPSDIIFDDIHTEGNVYNIFGHASASSFYSFGQARVKDETNMGKLLGNTEEGKNKTYFLSTDFSTTLFKTGIVCNKNGNKESDGLYDENYLLCILDTTKGELAIGIDGNITLSRNNYQLKTYNDFKTIDYNLAKEKKSTIFHKKEGSETLENTSKITLNFDKNNNLLEKIAKVDEYNGTKYLKYNGIATVSNDTVNPNNEDTKYYIYSSRFVKIVKDNLPYSIVLVPVSEIETESKIVKDSQVAGRQLKKRHRRKTKKGGRKTHKRRASKKRATKKKAARRKTKRAH